MGLLFFFGFLQILVFILNNLLQNKGFIGNNALINKPMAL